MQLTKSLWKTATMEATTVVGDDSLFVIQFIFRFLRVVVLLAIWRTLLESKGEAGGLTLGALLTYTLMAEAFAEQLSPRTEVEWAMHDGGITMRFLRPFGMVGQFVAQMAGRWFFGLTLFTLPLLLFSPLLGASPLPASAVAGLLFALSLLLTISVGVAFEFIFAALLVYLEGSAYLVARVRNAIALLLSGAVVPLAFMPWGLGDVFQWLPFASMASAPLRIYTETGDPLFLIGLQVGWSIILWPLANWLWRVNRERLVAYGG
jgi:ABC-2 type transport system permease protein